MRTVGMGIVLGAGLSLLAVGARTREGCVYGQHPGALERAIGDGSILALDVPTAEGGQQITLIDTAQRVMSVYHVDSSGIISLRSVRNVRWDLHMDTFNGGSPPPQEIRALVEQRK